LRAPIAAIYHFARSADDLADEGDATPAQRLAALQDYRQALERACHTAPAPDAPWAHVFVPLAHALARWALPVSLLHDLLDAFVQDVEMTRDARPYTTETQLLDYCRRSANPIGRLLLHLYGVHDSAALAQSDAICTALQLINFWQDPSVDLLRGRNYFPLDWCARFGCWPGREGQVERPELAGTLLAHCTADARQRMAQGAALVHRLPGRAGWELRLVVQGGLRVLEKTERLGARALRERPRLRAWDAPLLLWRALVMRTPSDKGWQKRQ
jgi:squalene synthase HpnC